MAVNTPNFGQSVLVVLLLHIRRRGDVGRGAELKSWLGDVGHEDRNLSYFPQSLQRNARHPSRIRTRLLPV